MKWLITSCFGAMPPVGKSGKVLLGEVAWWNHMKVGSYPRGARPAPFTLAFLWGSAPGLNSDSPSFMTCLHFLGSDFHLEPASQIRSDLSE